MQRKDRLEEDRRLAEELMSTEDQRQRDEYAWAMADAEAAADAAADEQKQWRRTKLSLVSRLLAVSLPRWFRESRSVIVAR